MIILTTIKPKKIFVILGITALFAVMLILMWQIFAPPSTLGLNVAGYEFVFNEEENSQFVLAELAEEIRWVNFDVPYEALKKAMQLEISARNDGHENVNWIEMLSYLACKYWGNWSNYRENDLIALAERLKTGEEMRQISEDMEQFGYFMRRYGAILSGFLGECEDGEYGLLVYFPIATGYRFSHSDDFGHSRSYGYNRRHLGHDLMASVGTPVVAIESGIVEVMGWNQYGGWRIGIRSHDGLRYWYYAHLRKDTPFHTDIAEGESVRAGQVIGYVGRTGYSRTENVNNIRVPHLHLGLQLVFDEAEKDGYYQVWIDLYAITRLLLQNRAAAIN